MVRLVKFIAGRAYDSFVWRLRSRFFYKSRRLGMEKRTKIIFVSWAIITALCFVHVSMVSAQPIPFPSVTLGVGETEEPAKVSVLLQILFLLTVLSLAPAILIMVTSFTRIVVVLSFLRQAMGTQHMPPNQIVIGIALFLTFFIMTPVWQEVNSKALQPYLRNEIGHEEALSVASGPVRDFMLRQTREKDLGLFVSISKMKKPRDPSEVPTSVIIPSFIISELKTAFQIGFMIYMPFLIIDMVVASVLLSMGMMMLPPIMISLPFKLMLFVLVDGWYLVMGSLVKSFA